MPHYCAKCVPWITAFIPHDRPPETCFLVFCILQLGGQGVERLTHLPIYTAGGSCGPGSETLRLPLQLGGLSMSLYVSSQSYWVYILHFLA